MPRGKKICPNCKTETGPRTKICGCGFDFFDQPVKTQGRQNDTPTMPSRASIVVIPAGKCPVEFPYVDFLDALNEQDKNSLKEILKRWVNTIKKSFDTEVANSALIYWVNRERLGEWNHFLLNCILDNLFPNCAGYTYTQEFNT